MVIYILVVSYWPFRNYEQGNWRKWYMHKILHKFSVGKFVLPRYEP
jgi:hypothetical protein